MAGLASGTAQGTQRTLPWSWYSDPELLRLEQERIFRAGWQYAGPAEHVAAPGDFFTCALGDVPVVVTRDRHGELHALLNVCRHRGSLVASGRGNRETLQCPYHAWTYGLDGRLRTAPRAAEIDVEEIALAELAVELWGPLVFVNADTAAQPLESVLGPVPQLLADGGVDTGRLRLRRRSDYELACNWKIAVENYLECYHCAVAHPGFSEVVDVSPASYRLETFALGSSQFGRTKNGAREVEGQFHWLWPVTKLYAMPGPPNLVVGPLRPEGPERTVGFFDYFFPEDVADADVDELIAWDDQVGLEDRALVASVQRGVRAGLLDEGRLLPESERLLAHFQALVREALA